MSAESALLQAKAEGLHLLRACTKSGYKVNPTLTLTLTLTPT